jgi:hypothetical protein
MVEDEIVQNHDRCGIGEAIEKPEVKRIVADVDERDLPGIGLGGFRDQLEALIEGPVVGLNPAGRPNDANIGKLAQLVQQLDRVIADAGTDRWKWRCPENAHAQTLAQGFSKMAGFRDMIPR